MADIGSLFADQVTGRRQIGVCRPVQRKGRQSRFLRKHGYAPLRLLQMDLLDQRLIRRHQIAEPHAGHGVGLGKRAHDEQIGILRQVMPHGPRRLIGQQFQITFVDEQINAGASAFLRNLLQKIFTDAVSDRVIGITNKQK